MSLLSKSTISAAILAGATTFVGQTQAAQIIQNGSFEESGSWDDGTGVADANDIGFSVYSHASQAYYEGAAPAGAGDSYGWKWGVGNGSGAMGSAQQFVDVAAYTGSDFTFSGWLAGYTGDDDFAIVTLAFFTEANGQGTQIGDTVEFNGNLFTGAGDYFIQTVDGSVATQDKFKLYSYSNMIPVNAVSAIVRIAGSADTSNGNDAYVDLLSLEVADIPEPASIAMLGLAGLAFVKRKNNSR